LDGGSAVDAGGACNIFILGDDLVAAAASAADVVTGVTEFSAVWMEVWMGVL
jgi:acyl CoA:acetate/3-ketoacid CoA transferase beta subunit